MKVTVVLLFIAFAARFVNTENWHPFVPPNEGPFGRFGASGVLQGATMVFFAYIGFDAVSTAAQEAKNPQRDLPIGILVSLGICTVLYIAVSLILTGDRPVSEAQRPASDRRRRRGHRAALARDGRRDRRHRRVCRRSCW